MTTDRALKRLKEIGGLCAKDNWDGYDAMAVTPRSIKAAKQLIEERPDGLQFVGPCPRGGVVIEWSGTHEVEIEVLPTARQYGFLFITRQYFEGDHVSRDTAIALIDRALAPRHGRDRQRPDIATDKNDPVAEYLASGATLPVEDVP